MTKAQNKYRKIELQTDIHHDGKNKHNVERTKYERERHITNQSLNPSYLPQMGLHLLAEKVGALLWRCLRVLGIFRLF